MNDNISDNMRRIGSIVRRYLNLQIDYARLTAIEKATVLLSTVAFFALALVIGLLTLVFLSIGVGHWLAATVAPHLAYLFVSAFYLVVLVLFIVFRKQLIFDPAARFISRLFLKDPDEDNEK